MKALFLTGEYPPMRGGIADHTAGLAAGLATQGIAASILTSTRAATGDVQRCPPCVYARIPAWSWGLFRQTRAALTDARADVLHIQYQTGAFAMHPAVNLLPWRLRRAGIPVVTTMHDLRVPYLFPKAGAVRPWVNRLLMQHSDAVIVTNPQDWQQAATVVRPDRLHLIPLANQFPVSPPPGYDRAQFRRVRGLDGRFVVAHFGMINHSKGVDTLVEAIARLCGEGVPATLVFAGETEGSSDPTNATEIARIQRMVTQYRLDADVVFTGFLSPSDVSAWLLAADAAALPFTDGASYRRTSMLAVLAHGLPLVTTEPEASASAGGLPQLHDGENCLLVPQNDTAALLAARLKALHEDPTLARRIGDGGRRLAQFFSWRRVAHATAQVYTDLTGMPHDPS